jgi:uncharacterized protein
LVAAQLAARANNAAAAAIKEHPDRFLGFATLPMRDQTKLLANPSAPSKNWALSAR